jgi:hypothetical protein
MQWHKKVWILKLKAREMAEKVKMCQNLGRDRPGRRLSPEKTYSSLMRYRLSKFFSLNVSVKEQAMQSHKKVWILKVRARELAEKLTMCQNLGRDRPRRMLSPEKAYSSVVRYRIFEFFRLNVCTTKQAMKLHKKLWILKLRATETVEKVKICQN